jgi:cytochrome c-type biogenesis protein
MGMAFAAGWTPCVGPILGSILALAGSSGSVGRGALLLLAYSLGLGVPFVAVALLFGRITPAMRWIGRHGPVLNKVAGSVLVLLGILIFTGRLGLVATWLTGVFSDV